MCATAAMTMSMRMGLGIGSFSDMNVRSHSGASPPGTGNRVMATPSHTKDMPSVTTIEGRSRRWMSAPRAA